MAFKNKLLATAAIPLIALLGMGSASAAGIVYPAAPAEAQSLVVKVQADEEEQLKQQRKERRENRQNNRQNQNDAGQDDQDNGNRQRRNKQDNAGQQQQDNSQEVQQPRRQKNNNNTEMQTQQSDQEQITPRRKKQSNDADTQQMQQQDNANQAQQDDQEQVKPRRKKQSDDAQMQQDNANQAQQDDQEQVKPRRKKKSDDAQMQQQDDAGQAAQQDDQEQVKPRRKKQMDNAASDEGQSTDDKLKNAINKNNKHKNKQDQNQDQAEQPTDNSNGSIEKIETGKKQQQADEGNEDQPRKKRAERPVDVKKAKDIAADPSKTTDTVVLPVENGAAVLDSDKDADNRGTDRNRRKQEREEIKQVRVPKSDKDAQRGFKDDKEVRIRPVLQEKGERIPGFKGYDDFGGRRIGDRGDRFVINIDGRIVIRSDDDTRVARNTQIRYERLPNNLVREVVIRPNGDRVVTVRNRWGEIVRRSRIDRSDREVVIFYSPVLERGRDRLFLRDPGDNLPPMRLTIPVSDYIIDVSGGGNRDYQEFLDEPPVEPVERIYSVDEVKNSARIRDKMRRIDLDTITFETGSADISEDQVDSLKSVGNAIKDILDKDPGETFLIEGHTDAVGSDESNLVLSDSRAESVANVLSEAFDIPAENLVTQGYGERFLKIDTDGPELENRRVTIRRITPLVRPLAAAEE